MSVPRRVPKRLEDAATRITREHPNHIVGSGKLWHWSYYHSGYGMASGWATSEKAAERRRNEAIGELQ